MFSFFSENNNAACCLVKLYFEIEDALMKEYRDFDNTQDASSSYAHSLAIVKKAFGLRELTNEKEQEDEKYNKRVWKDIKKMKQYTK